MTIIPELRSELVRAAREHRPAVARPRRRILGFPLALVVTLSVVAGATAAGFAVSEATKQQSEQLTLDPVLSGTQPGSAATVGHALEQQAQSLKRRLPYPPGMHDSFVAAGHDTAATLGAGSETQRETMLVLEYRAACLWRRYFLQSVDAGDQDAQADALSVLRQVPDWPATRSVASERAMQQGFADAAERGDVATLRRDVAVNCLVVR